MHTLCTCSHAYINVYIDTLVVNVSIYTFVSMHTCVCVSSASEQENIASSKKVLFSILCN